MLPVLQELKRAGIRDRNAAGGVGVTVGVRAADRVGDQGQALQGVGIVIGRLSAVWIGDLVGLRRRCTRMWTWSSGSVRFLIAVGNAYVFAELPKVYWVPS